MVNLNRVINFADFETVTKVVAPKVSRTTHFIVMTIMSLEILLMSILLLMVYSGDHLLIVCLNVVLVSIVMIILRGKYINQFTKEFYIIPPYTCWGIFYGDKLQNNIEYITHTKPRLLTRVEIEDSEKKRYFNYQPVNLKIVKPFTWMKKSLGSSFVIYNIEIVVTVSVFSSVSEVEWYLRELGIDEINIRDIHLLVYTILSQVVEGNVGSFMFSPTSNKKEDMIKTLRSKLFDELNKYAISVIKIDVRHPGQYNINIV